MNRYLGLFFISVFIYSGCSDPSSDSKIENTITDECSEIGSDTTFSKVLSGTAGYDIIRSSDCGYVISGSTGKTILMEIDEDGNELWSGTYGGISGSHWGNSVKQTSDGGYIIGAAQNLSLIHI